MRNLHVMVRGIRDVTCTLWAGRLKPQPSLCSSEPQPDPCPTNISFVRSTPEIYGSIGVLPIRGQECSSAAAASSKEENVSRAALKLRVSQLGVATCLSRRQAIELAYDHSRRNR